MARRKIPVSRLVALCGEVNSIPGRITYSRREWPLYDESFFPPVDVCAKEEEIVVEMELPGISPQDVTLVVHHNRLELRGEKKRLPHQERVNYLRLEREFGSFRRLIALPVSIEPGLTRAVLENGVLKIRMKKA